jgi:zinc-ribbon domain
MTSPASSFCPSCGSACSPEARFCPACGRGLGAAAGPAGIVRSADRVPWLIAGGALAGMLVLLLLLVVRGSGTPAASAAGPGPASGETGMVAPDISQLSPKERFDRLYNRVMQAAQAGDQATMTRFMPMALGAYEMLDSADADARYHAALLRVHNGDVQGSRALGDSILAAQPGHLLGYVVLGTTARWAKDDAELAKAYRGFLDHYDAEMKANRREYTEHRTSIDGFRSDALGAETGAGQRRPGS